MYDPSPSWGRKGKTAAAPAMTETITEMKKIRRSFDRGIAAGAGTGEGTSKAGNPAVGQDCPFRSADCEHERQQPPFLFPGLRV